MSTTTKVIPINPVTPISPTVCAVPWMHLAFEPSGQVVPCCMTSTYNYFSGNLKTMTIEEIWNSDNQKALRKDMINGIEPKICSKCFDRERVTGESSRTFHARDFPEVIEAIPNVTEPDGTCTTMDLKYWDFRFSNLCNMKCRSCGPRYSSAWVPDARKLGYADQEKVWSIDAVDDTTNFEFLDKQIENVKRIYFAGGEPLLMPEHWQILDMLVAKERFDVKLSYNINCSTLEYGKKNIIDYWSKWNFGKLEVWPSIDEIGDRAELVRSGTIWPKVEQNLIELSQVNSIILRPGITVGVFNVFRLPEIITHLVNIGVVKKDPRTKRINYNNFFINLLESPNYYHVHVLPEDFRKEIIVKLNNFIKEHNEKHDTDISKLFDHILHELTKPFDLVAAKRFVKMTRSVDEVRDENTYDTIPELRCIREAVDVQS
jgi:radical SAM protein with 4Fe4S-binding SPASM domain